MNWLQLFFQNWSQNLDVAFLQFEFASSWSKSHFGTLTDQIFHQSYETKCLSILTPFHLWPPYQNIQNAFAKHPYTMRFGLIVYNLLLIKKIKFWKTLKTQQIDAE